MVVVVTRKRKNGLLSKDKERSTMEVVDHRCRSADWVIRVKEFSDGDVKLNQNQM